MQRFLAGPSQACAGAECAHDERWTTTREVRAAGSSWLLNLRQRTRVGGASTILTSNKGFEEWGEIFGDDVMAAALVDRLVHHCHIVNIRGNSYRLRQHADLARRLHGSSSTAAVASAELEPRRSVKSKRQEELHTR
jgi:IstB-like ATP binding protein